MTDFEYSPRKKIPRINENEEDGGGGKKEAEDLKTVKQGSSSEKSFAKKYMINYGYKEGSGLGKHQDGIVEPVEASKQKGTRGFGFQPVDLYESVAKYDPDKEVVLLDEEVEWLHNGYSDTLSKECLESWVKIGPTLKCIDENSKFCDSAIVNDILLSKNALSSISSKNFDNGRRRSNPFETIQNGIFLNRAAMKMANLDAILNRMFTQPRNTAGKEVVGPKELLYFADVCAGPGGFSEYILYRKKWYAKGFGFTLRGDNDFALDKFWAGPPETFEPHYGVKGDGNVFLPENIMSFKEHVLKYTDYKGVHFMMADGGVNIEERFNDQELICKKLYLCQCLMALHIVRPEGHFVVKLFDLFTDFSVGLLYLMYRSFRQISIIKPNTSRPANSERYLVCKWKLENSSAIADFLFQINKSVPPRDEVSQKDVLELVPFDVLVSDKEFYDYIRTSNNRLGQRQAISLKKLAAYCEDINMKEEKRQQELRKECLDKWDIPDETRPDPRKYDCRSEFSELLANCLNYDKKEKIESFKTFKDNIQSIYDWYGVVVSGEETDSTCGLYLGLGRNSVHKYESGKWVKPKFETLSLPAKTLVYGEMLFEHLGSGKSQMKTYAFHIIDGMFLGGEEIRYLPFLKRLEKCRLFAKALYKETFPVRVKDHYEFAKLGHLWKRLTLKWTKSYTPCLGMPLESDNFYKAGGIIFIRDTTGLWQRYFSRSNSCKYLFNSIRKLSKYENEVDEDSLKEVYGDFEHCFQTRLIWWWGEGVVVHESQSIEPDPSKLQKAHIMALIPQHLQNASGTAVGMASTREAILESQVKICAAGRRKRVEYTKRNSRDK